MEIFFLKLSSVRSIKLIPSKVIFPSIGSKILVIRLNNVDLPSPEAPTIAIFLFGSNLTLKFSNKISSFGYPNLTFLNSAF